MTVFLRGPFRAVAADGSDCTPVSQKAQAMLALLATSPAFKRARVWLCDKLWSDRDPERAAGSLRQALSEVRRTLGPAAGLIGTDRRMVWLNPRAVVVDQSGPGEFLEGMDIRDPEWEDWLRLRRAMDDDTAGPPTAMQPSTPSPRKSAHPRPGTGPALSLAQSGTQPIQPVVALSVPKAIEPDARYLAGVVAELLARNLSETTGIRVHLDDNARSTLNLTLTPHIGGTGPLVSLSLRRRPDGAHLWSASRAILSNGIARRDDLALHALLAEAQDAVTTHYGAAQPPTARPTPDVAAETQRAARRIMSYDIRRMPEIEARLEQICDAEPNAATLGWLLLLKRIMFYERAAIATAEWVEQLIYRCEQAIALGVTNAFTLAAVSGAYLRLAGRPVEAIELAQRAERLNRSNPFALDALASAMYMTGRIDEGYRFSAVARALTANTSYAHFFDMSLSLASLLAGRRDQAGALADAALAIAPDFRAAWRTRIALCAARGNLAGAANATERLKRIEPGFSVDRMIHDPDYPITVLRQTCAPGFEKLGEIV
jgi:tetratricopeptide (TPR) repeat protein